MTLNKVRYDDKVSITMVNGILIISGFVFEGDGELMTPEEVGRMALEWFDKKVRKDYNATRWINIKDRLPDKDAPYLVHAPSLDPDKPFIHIVWYDPDFGWSLIPKVWINAITHWMPLPEPPNDA